jgi:non-ribosomal peptide synthetase component F
MPARTFNIADLFEAAVDEWPDRDYVADENVKRTYAEMPPKA